MKAWCRSGATAATSLCGGISAHKGYACTHPPPRPDAQQETWLIHYDIRVGSISMRAGVPVDKDQAGWNVGFHPASERGLRASGSAKSFEQARAAFDRRFVVAQYFDMTLAALAGASQRTIRYFFARFLRPWHRQLIAGLQRPHHADARQLDVAAMLEDQQQCLHRGLPAGAS